MIEKLESTEFRKDIDHMKKLSVLKHKDILRETLTEM